MQNCTPPLALILLVLSFPSVGVLALFLEIKIEPTTIAPNTTITTRYSMNELVETLGPGDV